MKFGGQFESSNPWGGDWATFLKCNGEARSCLVLYDASPSFGAIAWHLGLKIPHLDIYSIYWSFDSCFWSRHIKPVIAEFIGNNSENVIRITSFDLQHLYTKILIFESFVLGKSIRHPRFIQFMENYIMLCLTLVCKLIPKHKCHLLATNISKKGNTDLIHKWSRKSVEKGTRRINRKLWQEVRPLIKTGSIWRSSKVDTPSLISEFSATV